MAIAPDGRGVKKQDSGPNSGGQAEEAELSGLRMAHRDPKVAESARYMARPRRSTTVAYSSDPTWSDTDAEKLSKSGAVSRFLGALTSPIRAIPARVRSHGPRPDPGSVGYTSPMAIPSAKAPAAQVAVDEAVGLATVSAAAVAASASAPAPVDSPSNATAPTRARARAWSLPTGLSAGARRRFGPREAHRRELAIVVGLLLVACVASVALPEFTSSAPKPSATQVAAVDPTADPTLTAGPAGTVWVSPQPTQPPTTPAPTPKPKATVRPYTGKRYTFVALGDSLTAWPSYAWPERLDASDVRMTLVNNAGIPGNVTAQMVSRLNRDVFAYNPDVVIIMGGTNDLSRGYSTAQTIANLRAIIVACQKRKIIVFIATIPPMGYSGMAGRINNLNNAIVRLANNTRTTWISVHDALSTSKGVYVAGYGLPDNLHLTNRGSQVLANTVYYRIRRRGY